MPCMRHTCNMQKRANKFPASGLGNTFAVPGLGMYMSVTRCVLHLPLSFNTPSPSVHTGSSVFFLRCFLLSLLGSHEAILDLSLMLLQRVICQSPKMLMRAPHKT